MNPQSTDLHSDYGLTPQAKEHVQALTARIKARNSRAIADEDMNCRRVA